jgi:hypothetical protein
MWAGDFFLVFFGGIQYMEEFYTIAGFVFIFTLMGTAIYLWND